MLLFFSPLITRIRANGEHSRPGCRLARPAANTGDRASDFLTAINQKLKTES